MRRFDSKNILYYPSDIGLREVTDRLYCLSDGNLHVSYRAVAGKWESSLSGLEMDVWYTIDLSWDNENGMTVYVNNMQRSWSQVGLQINME